MNKVKEVAIGAIFKNEFEYILEWLAFHRIIGIKKFFIADNGSNDGSSQLLMALEQAGYITRVFFPTINGKAPQIPAYDYILSKYKDEISFIGFIDADEFIVPETMEVDFVSWLDSLYERGDISAIGLNWSIYGSSGKIKREEKLVIERFNHHALKSTGVNRHIKSFVRADKYDGFYSPHSVKVTQGEFIDTKEDTINLDKNTSYSLTNSVCWNKARINHYVIKSWDEFKEKKQEIGRAMTSSKRNDDFFTGHDLNDCTSKIMCPYIPLVEDEINNIKNNVRKHSKYYSDPVLHIDVMDQNRIKGWIFTVNDAKNCQLRVVIDNTKEYIISADQIRDDVYKSLEVKGCISDVCGFDFLFPEKLNWNAEIYIEAHGVQNTPEKNIKLNEGVRS